MTTKRVKGSVGYESVNFFNSILDKKKTNLMIKNNFIDLIIHKK
jgi:hypothetical protein